MLPSQISDECEEVTYSELGLLHPQASTTCGVWLASLPLRHSVSGELLESCFAYNAA